MCIIAAKPAGTKMPATTTIENMWYRNHDGAGFMYAHGGTVHIEKGFMKLDDFKKALERVQEKVNLNATSVVMHFRIATHGGVMPANTHPFPVTSSISMLQKLKCTTSLGVAHNGIISSVNPRKGISDTMEYIASQLAPLYKGVPTFYENPNLMEMVSNAIESKLAILTGKGALYTIGNFETDEGILYSNSSYKAYKFEGKYWDDCWGRYAHYPVGYADVPYEFSYSCLMRSLWDDENTYAVDGKGRLLDMFEDELAVDGEGKLYKYVYSCDGFVQIPGGRAYDANGETLAASQDDNDNYVRFEEVYTEASPFDEEPPFEMDQEKTEPEKLMLSKSSSAKAKVYKENPGISTPTKTRRSRVRPKKS